MRIFGVGSHHGYMDTRRGEGLPNRKDWSRMVISVVTVGIILCTVFFLLSPFLLFHPSIQVSPEEWKSCVPKNTACSTKVT